MKKLFTILAAALFSVSMMADDYVLSSDNFDSDKATATIDGQVFIMDPAYPDVAGTNTYADWGPTSLKLSGKTTYTITLPYGFTASNVNIKGYSNDNSNNSGIAEFNGAAVSDKTFLTRSTANIKQQDCVTTGYDFSLSSEATSFSFKIGNKQSCVLITITGTPATCTPPSIAWNIEPEGGNIGDADFVASVTTTPAEGDVVWTSSNEEVATVVDGTIHYVGIGSTTITASFTYDGEDFCKTTVKVTKDIFVPIDAITPGENDRVWYYQTAVPTSNPDNGLNYGSTITAAPLYGIKLNSDGYAWFAKPDVAGTLRIGAYYKNSSTKAYEVNVFACNEDGTGVNVDEDTPLGVLSTASAGVASNKLAIAKDVKGIYLKRKTQNEGALYFVEFEAEHTYTVGWSYGEEATIEQLGDMEREFDKGDPTDDFTKYFDKDVLRAGTYTVKVFEDGAETPIATTTLNIAKVAKYHLEFDFHYAGNSSTVTASATETGEPTAVDNTVDNAKAIKTIENGQLVIIKNGVRYNVLGAELR